jgi:hypothetical protein
VRRGAICGNVWRLMAKARRPFFLLAHQAMGETQAGLGEALGVARRTAQRWAQSGVPSYYMPDLAKLVHPHDADLAAEIAAAVGTTLEALGLVVPAAAPALESAPVPQPAVASAMASAAVASEGTRAAVASASGPAPAMPDAVVDAVVCAAAEVMNLPPREVRAGLHAAFASAKEIGLTVDVVERALRAKQQAPRPAPARRALPSPLRVERPLPAPPDDVE